MTLKLIDLEELGEKALSDFNAAVRRDEGFDEAFRRLVAKVEVTYAVAAKLAHREQTMEGIAAIWTKMVALCDDVAREVKELEGKHPGGKASFDRILDLRNAAENRRELHS